MDPYDLPEQLSVLQSYDMSKIGFLQDLIHGISKVLAPEKPEEEKEQELILQEGGANLLALLKRGGMALEDHEWQRADEFFEQVLNMNAECAQAFLGKALAQKNCVSLAELVKDLSNISDIESTTEYACPVDEARIEAVVSKYAVPGFLSAKKIKNLLSEFDLTYSSRHSAFEEKLEDIRAYFEDDKNMRRAIRYAHVELKTQILTAQKESQSILKEALDQQSQQDQQTIEKITAAYHAFLDKTEDNIAQQYIYAKREEEDVIRARQDKLEKYEKKRRLKNRILTSLGLALAIVIVSSLIYSFCSHAVYTARQYEKAQMLLDSGDKAQAAVIFGSLSGYKDAHNYSISLWNEIVHPSTISAGHRYSVALKEDGTVVAAGSNSDRQCNTSDWTDIKVPN